MKATHIYHNGVILTMDSRASIVSCLAVHGDRILAVGSDADMAPLRDANTRTTNLQGRCMLPGFYDCHSHYMRAGMYSEFYLDVAGYPVGTVCSLDDIARRVRDKAATLAAGQWILCAGYDDTATREARHFTLAELDALAPEHPLFIRHCSGHLALCNSKALEAAGVGSQTRDPQGGCFRRDAEGRLTGLVEEPVTMEYILAASPPMTEEKWLTSVRRAARDYAAQGVTTAQEGGTTTAIWQNYMTAHQQGLLQNRVQLLPRYGAFDFSLAPSTRCGTSLTADNMLSLGAVKLFQDGSLQNYTGYLSNPYHSVATPGLSHGPLWRGYPIHETHNLTQLVTKYHKDGWQVAIHGNGDDAIDNILDSFEDAQKSFPRADARHTIIHCQTVREDQLDRMRRIGVIPSFFVVHVYYWGDRHRDMFLGESRAARINPLRSALERRISFTNHNDTAVTPINPRLSVWAAANRLTSSGKTLGPEQIIPVLDALRSVTTWGAYQFHEEHLKGSLEPGKLADMVVLNCNPLTIAPEDLRDVGVLSTIVGDKCIYEQPA